ncbi:MAG: hypothetical protein ACE5L6_04790, partial [Candidatus Bathyarchaeia archaeon]
GSYGRTLGILLSIREDFIDVFEPDELQNRFRNECLPLPILYAFKNPHTKKVILEYLSRPDVSDKDAEMVVDIVFEEENVEMLRNKVKSLAQETYSTVSDTPNQKLASQIKILIKSVIEDL